VDKKEVEKLLNTAISEINYSLKSHKSKEVKEFYQENAIRFINMAKEKLNSQFDQTVKEVKNDFVF